MQYFKISLTMNCSNGIIHSFVKTAVSADRGETRTRLDKEANHPLQNRWSKRCGVVKTADILSAYRPEGHLFLAPFLENALLCAVPEYVTRGFDGP